MGSQLFGPLDKDSDIRVGYIDGDNGFVEGLSVCEANEIARKDPGTVFIFKSGDKVLQYLNINGVNSLTTDDVKGSDNCAGINQKVKCGPPKIQITGGGGIGAVGNPIVGVDGSLLAVDIVRTGHGYAFPPQVTANDDCQYGAGSVLTAVLGELVIEGEELVIRSPGSVSYGLNFRRTGSIRGYRGGSETYLYQYYDRPEDYEEYFLCDQEFISYGNLWGPNGEDLGEWKPTLYIGGRDPIAREVQEFQDDVRALEGGFFNTRKTKPSAIYSNDPTTTGGWYHVDFGDAWGDFQNKYAISPKPPSNVRGSDFAGILFTYEWNLDFPTTGDYTIRGTRDNKAKLYIDNQFISDLDGFRGAGTEIKKYYKEGAHQVRLELLNLPIYEKIKVDAKNNQQNANAKFVQKSGGIYLVVDGGSDVEVAIKFGYNDDPGTAGTALTRAQIDNKGSRPSLLLSRKKSGGTFQKKGNVSGKATFSPGEYGPIKLSGTSKSPQLAGDKKINFFDRHGRDVNADLTIISTKGDPKPKKIQPAGESTIENIEVFNTIDWIGRANRRLWRTNPAGGSFFSQYGICPFDTTQPDREDNPYAGTHRIVWSNLKFPADANYQIEVEVDDNVTLTFEKSTGEKISFKRNGFKPGTDIGVGKLSRTEFFTKGNYTLIADLEQIPGGRFGFSGIKGTNPMSLAVRVSSSIAEVTVLSPKSWNENPMGVALTIDAPEPIVPQEPAPIQDGRCPPNPIWSTRSSGAKEQWFPVSHSFPGNIRSWSLFTNRYAISPVKPLAQKGTDSGGVVFSNSWTVEIPFDGYYGLKATADNGGRILIDGVEQLAGGLGFTNTNPKLGGFAINNPETKKIFLSEGTHTVDVEVLNESTLTYDTIEKQIFSTQNWASPRAQSQFVDVQFRVTSAADFANGVEIVGIFSYDKTYKGSQINETTTKQIEVGRVYDVIFRSNDRRSSIKLRTKGNQIIEMEDYKDNDFTDIIIASNQGRFFDINGNRAKFIVGTNSNAGTVKKIGDVTYSGPEIFRYNHPDWGTFMNKNNISPYLPPLDQENQGILGVKSYVWSNVDFPEDGQYIIKFVGDNTGSLFINDQKVASSGSFRGQPVSTYVNLSKGRYTVKVDMENVPNDRDVFLSNPTGVALKITKMFKVPNNTKPWAENPIGISAILIAPPCPRRIDGRGLVTDILVEDPGNGYTGPDEGNRGYPALIKLKEVLVKDPGINYNCGVDELVIEPSNGAELDYECDTFGRIVRVKVLNPGIGFTEYPTIRMPSNTGVNFKAVPLFDVERDPVAALTGEVPLDKLVQVTDLVGLKQTGYVDGRAYYGAVFYKEGVRYAGYFGTAGQLIQVYDTLQESIDAEVTTAPSAIQRQGTDTNSNNPRLDIPGTPDELI